MEKSCIHLTFTASSIFSFSILERLYVSSLLSSSKFSENSSEPLVFKFFHCRGASRLFNIDNKYLTRHSSPTIESSKALVTASFNPVSTSGIERARTPGVSKTNMLGWCQILKPLMSSVTHGKGPTVAHFSFSRAGKRVREI